MKFVFQYAQDRLYDPILKMMLYVDEPWEEEWGSVRDWDAEDREDWAECGVGGNTCMHTALCRREDLGALLV